jgi:hypothetical protein
MVEQMHSSTKYLTYCKNFCKFHMYPHSAQQCKKKKETLKMMNLLEIKSVLVHFQGKAIEHRSLFAYQLVDDGRWAADRGT